MSFEATLGTEIEYLLRLDLDAILQDLFRENKGSMSTTDDNENATKMREIVTARFAKAIAAVKDSKPAGSDDVKMFRKTPAELQKQGGGLLAVITPEKMEFIRKNSAQVLPG
jgi:hypothetical protein